MSGMEWNKIFAALLIAGILAMFSGFVADLAVHPQKTGEHAYPVEGVSAEDAGAHTAETAAPEPILALIAQIDPAQGERLSRACAACHTFNKGGAERLGPNLWDVVNKPKANNGGFAYSDALAQSGGSWTYESLNVFLWKPRAYVPGTKMNYIGLRKPEDRAAMIAWLRTLSDTPAPLPTQAEIEAQTPEAVVEP